MAAKQEIEALLAELERTRQVLGRIEAFYRERFGDAEASREQTVDRAIVLSEVLCNFYTCLETFFLRVSQLFENSLDATAWHRDLLKKMVLAIEGEREAVLSESAYHAAGELLRFRHFKRYYFEFEYDWDRLALVEKKYLDLVRILPQDLDSFEGFLRSLLKELAAGESS